MSLIYLSLCSIIINERWGDRGSLLEGGCGQRGAIRPEEVYWGSLLGKSTGQQGPSRLPPGLGGGGLGKEGEGGEGAIPPPYFSRKYGGGCVLAAGPPPYFRQNVGGNDLTRGRVGAYPYHPHALIAGLGHPPSYPAIYPATQPLPPEPPNIKLGY